MPNSRSRNIADFLGATDSANTNNIDIEYAPLSTIDDSSSVASIIQNNGIAAYSTKDNLPLSGLTLGQQAYVIDTKRYYISNGSGWYNIQIDDSAGA